MIELSHVSKSYDKGMKKAVDDLTLEVRPGEIFGFLGPNGAGKTTTVKMLVGLLRADQGRVIVNGIDVARQPLEAKRQVGFVPDTPEVYDRLSGLEYLNFIGDVFGVPPAQRRERIEHLAETFELTGALKDRIGGYSHGMQQKLVLISALLNEPPVWVLDEPMVGLDPRSAHDLKQLMADHCARGNTVFFSTHVLEVAERLCDRVGIINKGRLIALGTMEELRQGEGRDGESLETIFLELTES
ncbi:MAG: ABC transporter ATP-binding protein [Firmicutes bacterium]|nr:ABC transporter ATP-binding protein [Bacillota bacterium]